MSEQYKKANDHNRRQNSLYRSDINSIRICPLLCLQKSALFQGIVDTAGNQRYKQGVERIHIAASCNSKIFISNACIGGKGCQRNDHQNNNISGAFVNAASSALHHGVTDTCCNSQIDSKKFIHTDINILQKCSDTSAPKL